MRRRAGIATILAAVMAMAAGAATADDRRPEVVIDVGHTLAVKGDPGGGGIALGVSLLWRVEERFRIGVTATADGLGERTGRLLGPGGVDLGPIAELHRVAQGAALRLEAHPGGEHRLDPYLAASWGLYRVRDDVRGAWLGSDDAAGLGLGAGVLRRFSDHHAAGLAVRGQQLSRGGAGRYLAAALEWRWSMSAKD